MVICMSLVFNSVWTLYVSAHSIKLGTVHIIKERQTSASRFSIIYNSKVSEIQLRNVNSLMVNQHNHAWQFDKCL